MSVVTCAAGLHMDRNLFIGSVLILLARVLEDHVRACKVASIVSKEHKVVTFIAMAICLNHP